MLLKYRKVIYNVANCVKILLDRRKYKLIFRRRRFYALQRLPNHMFLIYIRIKLSFENKKIIRVKWQCNYQKSFEFAFTVHRSILLQFWESTARGELLNKEIHIKAASEEKGKMREVMPRIVITISVTQTTIAVYVSSMTLR